MNKLKSLLILLFIITTLVIVFYGAAQEWYSFIILSIILISGSIIGLSTFFKEERENIVHLFLGVFSFYALYMMITNYLYVDNPTIDFFMMVDSKKFWEYSNYKMFEFSDVIKYQSSDYSETIRYTMFNFGNLCLSFFAQLFDENNILVQKLQSVYLGALSIPFIYLSFRKFFDKKRSFKYSLFYAIFTHVCIYSVVFNRDPHVYFFYTLGFYYLIYYDTKRKVLFKLFIIFIFILGYRLEHGLFFLLFILSYLYLKSRKDNKLKIFIFVLIPIFLIIISPFVFNKFQDNSESYQELINRTESEESVSATLSKLPPVIKEVTMTVNSQLAPAVPFWRFWYPHLNQQAHNRHNADGYFTPWRFMESIANITWIYVWGVILLGIIRKKYSLIPKEVNYTFLIAVLLLALASTSVNARRTYCVYPIVFLYSVYTYNLLSVKQKRRIVSFTTIFFASITILYLTIKGT